VKINWEVRLKNKSFWLMITPAICVLVSQVLELFGVHLDLTGLAKQIADIIETVFLIIGLLGIVVDPTTVGIGDSVQALTYTKPKSDKH
jgi:phi LC3 family holin